MTHCIDLCKINKQTKIQIQIQNENVLVSWLYGKEQL